MASIALGLAAPSLFGLQAGSVAASIASGFGSAVGAFVDAKYVFPALFREGSREPSYGSVSVSAADEGAPIWRWHGERVRVPCQILFTSAVRQEAYQQTFGKRGELTQRSYAVDLAIGLGKVGENDNVDSILRILADSQGIVDLRSDISKDVFYEWGQVGSLTIAGMVANYDEQITRFVSQGDTRPIVSLETYPEVGTTALTVTASSFSGYITTPFGSTVLAEYEVTFDGNHGIDPTTSKLTYWDYTGSTLTVNNLWRRHRWRYVRAHPTDPAKVYMVGGLPDSGDWSEFDVYVATSRPGYPTTVDLTVFDPGNNVDVVNLNGTESWPCYSVRDLGDDRTSLLLRNEHSPLRSSGGVNVTVFDSAFWADDFWHALTIRGDRVRLDQARTGYDPNVLENGASDVEYPADTSAALGGTGVQDQVATDRLKLWAGVASAPGYRDWLYVTLRDFNLSSFSNRMPNLEAVVACSDTTIASVVSNICQDHGIATEDIDTGNVSSTKVCRGYRYNGVVDGVQKLEPLVLAHDIVPVETSDGIAWYDRELSPTVAVPGDDWISEDNVRLALTQQESQAPLSSVTVGFFDAERDLEQGAVTERRQSQPTGETRSINLNLTMTEDEARDVAQRVMRLASSPSYRIRGRLPWTYAHLAENDIIETTIDSLEWRFRVQRVDIGADGEIVVEGVQERRSPSPSYPESAESAEASDTRIAGASTLSVELLYGVSWQTGVDGTQGVYVAATGLGGLGFAGAAVYASTDGESSWGLLGTLRTQATTGYVRGWGNGVLPDSSADTWDTSSSIEVALFAGELESVAESLAQAGTHNLALIGDEVVNFATAAIANDGTSYRLTDLLRGQHGTSATDHEATERFVLLDSKVGYFALPAISSPTTVYIRVVPTGWTIDDVDSQTISVTSTEAGDLLAETALSGAETGSSTSIGLEINGSAINSAGGVPVPSSRVAARVALALRHNDTPGSRSWTATLHRIRNGVDTSVATYSFTI